MESLTLGPSARTRSRPVTAVLKLTERALTQHVTLMKNRALSQNMHLLTLAGHHLCGTRWEPGQKVDIEIGELSYRAYTPCRFDGAAGEMDLLVYRNRSGPGSERLCLLQPGGKLRMRGPKNSTVLNTKTGDLAFFGDETSVALMCAFRIRKLDFTGKGSILECRSVQHMTELLERLNLGDTTVLARERNDNHLARASSEFKTFIEMSDDHQIVLSGRAASIQFLRGQLTSRGIEKVKIVSHAFWAEGKVALG